MILHCCCGSILYTFFWQVWCSVRSLLRLVCQLLTEIPTLSSILSAVWWWPEHPSSFFCLTLTSLYCVVGYLLLGSFSKDPWLCLNSWCDATQTPWTGASFLHHDYWLCNISATNLMLTSCSVANHFSTLKLPTSTGLMAADSLYVRGILIKTCASRLRPTGHRVVL
jgi:hypothetical protein